MSNLFWFKSSEHKVIEDEDKETNQGRYGKEVSVWLSKSLNELGYETDNQPDDWGWRIQCMSEPCTIWIGCANMDGVDENGDLEDADINDITWHCFIHAEIPFFKKLFGKIDPSSHVAKLSDDLLSILSKNQSIELVEEP